MPLLGTAVLNFQIFYNNLYLLQSVVNVFTVAVSVKAQCQNLHLWLAYEWDLIIDL